MSVNRRGCNPVARNSASIFVDRPTESSPLVQLSLGDARSRRDAVYLTDVGWLDPKISRPG